MAGQQAHVLSLSDFFCVTMLCDQVGPRGEHVHTSRKSYTVQNTKFLPLEDRKIYPNLVVANIQIPHYSISVIYPC